MMSVYERLTFTPMLLTDIFDSARQAPAWLNTNAVEPGEGRYAHVTNSGSRNSVAGFIAHQQKGPNAGNAITIGIDTQVVAYQPAPFYGGTKVFELRSSHLNQSNGQILTALIRKGIKKFSWGYKASATRLKKTRVMIPTIVDAEGVTVADWDGMTALGEELFVKIGSQLEPVYETVAVGSTELPELTFMPMLITDLFKPHKGKRLIAEHREPGQTLFVGGSELNNSVTDMSDVEPLFPGGWLTLTYNGSIGQTRFQPVPFYASDDVIALEPLHEKATQPALLVLATLIQHVCVDKFSYAVKLNLSRLRRQKIMVPTTIAHDGSTVPDWEGMTAYGQVLRSRAESLMQAGAPEMRNTSGYGAIGAIV